MAIDSVIAADEHRLHLLEEQERLEVLADSGDLEATERLQEIYDELTAIGKVICRFRRFDF